MATTLAPTPTLGSAASYVSALARQGMKSSPAGWTPGVFAQDVAKDLDALVGGKALPNQQDTSLCGAAAFAYCLLRDRPDVYARTIHDLWMTGRAWIGTLALAPNQKVLVSRDKGSRQRFVDWMMLASLRNSGGRAAPIQPQYNSPTGDGWGSVGEGVSGITTPDLLASWFRAAGSPLLSRDAYSLVKPDGLLKRELDSGPITGPAGSSLARRNAATVLAGLERNRQRAWTPLLIDADILTGVSKMQDALVGSMVANHWVVLGRQTPILLRERPDSAKAMSPLALDPKIGKVFDTPLAEATITLGVVTWGDERRRVGPVTVEKFLRYYYGSLTFGRFQPDGVPVG